MCRHRGYQSEEKTVEQGTKSKEGKDMVRVKMLSTKIKEMATKIFLF